MNNSVWLTELALRLQEAYRGLTKNPRWLFMRNFGQFDTIRSVMRTFSKGPAQSFEAINQKSSAFENLDVEVAIASLKTDGLFLGINLPLDILEEIIAFAYQTPCYANRDLDSDFYYWDKEQAKAVYPRPILTGHYFNIKSSCPAIKRLVDDPKLLAIAAAYFDGVEPVNVGIKLWWSFVTEGTYFARRRFGQEFHYDMDDYRFLKFFFYLTDVDSESGCHVCVIGSHRRKKLLHKLLRCSPNDKELTDYYGDKKLVPIYGDAGFGFAEDTFCFHKAIPPKVRDRLFLVLQFATHDYGMEGDPSSPLTL